MNRNQKYMLPLPLGIKRKRRIDKTVRSYGKKMNHPYARILVLFILLGVIILWQKSGKQSLISISHENNVSVLQYMQHNVTKRSIKIDAPICEDNSMGELSCQIALALDRFGWDVYLDPWPGTGEPDYFVKRAGGRIYAMYQKGSCPDDQCDVALRVDHPNTFHEVKNGRVRVGFTFIESTTMPQTWVTSCNKNVDEILVPSTFVRDSMISSGVKTPIFVYHHGIVPELFQNANTHVQDSKSSISKNKPFTFLSLARAQKRKGTDIIIKAFEEAFKDENDVRLQLVTTPNYPFYPEYQSNDTKIEFHHRETPYTREEIANFYKNADCFVLPTLGEGFGMPALEAMAAGLPTIITGWSGNIDFCRFDVCYLIHLARMEPHWHHTGQSRGLYGIPDVNHLMSLMQEVKHNPDAARAKGKRAREEVFKNWTWDAATKRFLNIK